MAIICLPISQLVWVFLNNTEQSESNLPLLHTIFLWLGGCSCLVMVRFPPFSFLSFLDPPYKFFRAGSAFYTVSALCVFLVIVQSTMMSP